MKILLSAYSCGVTATSELGVGWRNVNHALSAGHEVWTISETHCEAPLLEYLAEHPMPGYHPVFFNLAAPLAKFRHLGGGTASVLYHLWQQKLQTVARELHEKVGFDLAHHVTFARYWSPSGVRNLGIPFLWGPVGAAESTPPSFLSELSPRNRLFEFARDSIRAISHQDPALRDTAKKATIALGVTRESCEIIRKLGAQRVVQLPSGSLTDEELVFFDNMPPPPENGPFRVLCLGRLLHWKGFYLAIRAFAIFARKNPEAELWIVGTGPFQEELEKTAAQTGVSSQVRFWGYLPHAEAMEKLAQAHVLLHPALHEGFGHVCLEAMACGRPVACLDVGGPATQVTAETGFVAPVTNPEEAVQAMASFLARIAHDRDYMAELSAKGRARVREEFTMRQTGAALSAFYAEAIASHAEAPRRNS